MARYLVVIPLHIFLVLMSVNSTELPTKRQRFGFETLKPEMANSELNNYQDDSTQLSIITNDYYFYDYDSDLMDVNKEVNSIINMKTVSEGTKMHNKNTPNENNINSAKKKLRIPKKSKLYPFEKLTKKTPIINDKSQVEITQPQLEVRWPVLFASEETRFGHAWPKYFEHSIDPVLPFPELDIKRDAWNPPLEIMANRQDNDRRINSDLFKSELKSDSKRTELETESLESSYQNHAESSKTKKPLPSIKNEEANQETIKARNQLLPQDRISQLHQSSIINASDLSQMQLNHTRKSILHFLVNKQSHESNNVKNSQADPTDNFENPTQTSVQKLSDGKLNHQILVHEPISDSSNLPWQLDKVPHYEPIMPFPELHGAEFRHQVKDINLKQDKASQKRSLPFAEERSTPEAAGPLLYPQSNFEKEFRVPFF